MFELACKNGLGGGCCTGLVAVLGKIGKEREYWADRNLLVDDCLQCRIAEERCMPNDVYSGHHSIEGCFVAAAMRSDAYSQIVCGIANNLQFFPRPNLNFARACWNGAGDVNLDDVGAFFNLATNNTHHFFFVANDFGVTSSARIGNQFSGSATDCSH